jgi:DNA-binding NarL/FixJ family response regulator
MARGRTKTGSQGTFLVLDDDVQFAASLKRLLSDYGDVTTVHCVEDALSAKPPSGAWTALFLDFNLPDGDAFTLLDGLEARGESVPAVIITGELTDALANRAFERGVKILTKPIGAEHAKIFLDTLRDGVVLVGEVVLEWSTRYGLTASETAVLRDGVEGVDRSTLAESRGISESTLRTHVRHMLQKTGDASMSDAIQRALREVIGRNGT